MQRLWHCNADFDLNLPHTQSSKALPTLPQPLLEMTDEMAWHFAFIAEPDDFVFTQEPWSESWISLLRERNIVAPHFTSDLESCRELIYSPYGWDKVAHENAKLFRVQPNHPAITSVQRVNDRLLSWQLETKLSQDLSGWDATEATPLENTLEINSWFEVSKVSRGLLKGRYGMSGVSNRLLTPPPWTDSFTMAITRLLRKSGGAILEPWHRIETEFGWRFFLHPDGHTEKWGGHTLLTVEGAFRGILIAPDGRLPQPIENAWENVMPLVAKSLHEEGYFGPVGLDGYLHKLEFPNAKQSASRFRPLSDLNARYTMASAGHGLRKQFPNRHLAHLLLHPPRKDWVGDWYTFEAILGEMAWNKESNTGVTVLTPWRKASGKWARRISILVSAVSSEELLERVNKVCDWERAWKV